MPPRYATQTSVPPEKSRAEIEAVLTRYGASAFMSAWDQRGAHIGCKLRGRTIQFGVPLPDRDAPRFTHTTRGTSPYLYERTADQAHKAWEQEVRSSWRALLLVIKAKLEAVEAGIVTFEQEFAMHMVLPDGRHAAEVVVPWIAEAHSSGVTPALMPPPSG